MGKYRIKQEKVNTGVNKTKNIQKLSKENQKDNIFYLKKIESQQQEIIVEFPIMEKSKTILGIPKFRNDKLFYTSSFSLANEVMTKSRLKDQKQIFKARAKIEAQDDEDSFILFPSPNNSAGNCMVCREKFQKYRQHIQSETHIDKIKKSLYNFRISQLCIKYQLEKFFKGAQDLQQTKKQQTKEIQIPKLFLNIGERQVKTKEKNLQQTKQSLYMQLKQQLKIEGKNKEMECQINPSGLYNIYDVLQF